MDISFTFHVNNDDCDGAFQTLQSILSKSSDYQHDDIYIETDRIGNPVVRVYVGELTDVRRSREVLREAMEYSLYNFY